MATCYNSGMKFYTYIHTRNDTSEVFYVGKGKGRRAVSKARNVHWKRIVEKHGYTSQIVAHFASEGEAFLHEKELICHYRNLGAKLCNMTDGGEGVSNPPLEVREKISSKAKLRMADPSAREHLSRINMGHAVSEETRGKISIAGKGRVPSAIARARISAASKGRTVSAEARSKIGAAHAGKVVSDETRARQSAAGKNRVPMSLATREKIGAASKGRVCSDEKKRKIGAANKGRKLSDAHIATMRVALLGNTNAKGYKHTPEVRASLLLRKHSDETKAKISAAKMGTVPSPEARAAMSAAGKARWARVRNEKENHE